MKLKIFTATIAIGLCAISCKKEAEEDTAVDTTTAAETTATASGATTDTTTNTTITDTTKTDTTTNSTVLVLGDFYVDGKKKDFANLKKLVESKNGFMARLNYANSGEASKTLDVNVVSAETFPYAATKTFTGVFYNEYVNAVKNDEALVEFFTTNANTEGYHIKVIKESDGSTSVYTDDLIGNNGEKIEFYITIKL